MKRVLGGLVGVSLCSGFILFKPLYLPEPQGLAYQELPKLPFSQHPNRHFLSKVPQKIGIIGGGISGLVTAKVLKQQGYDVQILEKRNHIGGVWYDNYEGAGLQGPYYTYNMPDFTFPAATPMLPKQELVLQYLERYVQEFGLQENISLDCEVGNIRQLEDSTWEVDLKDGSNRAFDFLIVCNGAYHKPYIPSFPGAASFKGQILHSSQFKQAHQLCTGKRIVVIGGGKSALDILEVTSDSAITPVIGLMRNIHWTIPLSFTLLGLNPGYTMFSRFISLFHSADYAESGWINWVLQPIGLLYWRFIEKRILKDLPPSARPNIPLSSEYPHFDTRTKSFTSKLNTQEILIKRGNIDHFTDNGLVTTDKETIYADIVVMATGFDRDFLGMKEENGEQWRYRGMVIPEVRNFAVIGHISTIRTALVINLQAVWLSEVLRGQVILPSKEDMQADNERRKNYNRKGEEKGRKSLHYRVDFLADQLLGDMKLQTRRAKTWFQHYFGRVNATDYRSVVTHRV